MNQYDKQHKKNLTQYERQIGDLMDKTQQQVAQLVALWARDLKEDTPFRWNDYPVANQRMETVLKQLTTDLQQSIENGITQEWALSNQKNDHFTQTAFGEYLQQLPEERRDQYLNTNQDAQEAFKQRKVQGLNLSGRVWNITKEYKEEVEMALDTAIRDGLPATTLATRLKQYLHNPDALFRRVRNRWGELELSKHARAYHPGRGVYRSAYKNARRTAATEINIAYRTSDFDRWQQMDFVVGIEIEPSPTNHKDYDLCNTLAGKYPKGFKFTGWHPHCRCIATPILKTKQEMQRDTERILQGKEPEQRSENTVQGVPKNYEQWVEDNQQRIRRNTMPYFLKDNGEVNSKGEYEIKKFPQLQKDNIVVQHIIEENWKNTRKAFHISDFKKEEYEKYEVASFGLIELKQEMETLASQYGASITSAKISPMGQDWGFWLTGKSADGGDIDIRRAFGRMADKSALCIHAHFKIPKSMQGKGFSKQAFRLMYGHYKRYGVSNLFVCANIDVGGYTWAKYGFQASVIRVEQLCRGNDDILQLLAEYKEKEGWNSDFPMNRLIEKFGKDRMQNILLGKSWNGCLDLNNEAQRKYFEHYIGWDG